MNRELFVVEKLRDGQWVPRPNLVALSRHDHWDYQPESDLRVTKYVPEDQTPRLLADWQDKHRGQVVLVSSEQGTVCVLTSSDNRQAGGESVPCDPFGAARDALTKWKERYP